MVSNDIFLQLIEAMKDDAKLIMVGDLGQLPSIGVGPAKGIVNSNIVPSITLKNIHRQAKESAIITHSIAFRHGEKPEDFDFKNRAYGAKEDLKYMFVHKDAEPKIEGLAIEVFKQKIEQYKVNDIAIITSTRKFVYNLNVMAQRIANPPSPSKKEFVVNEAKNNEYTLRVGDKVMNVRNNYNTVNIHDELQPIFNGNTGVILDIVEDDKSMVAIIEFDGVDTVKVPLSKFGSPIELGYSMTVHKSQGDTIKEVIVALPYQYMLNTRELLYTAITRAADECFIITSPRTLKATYKKSSDQVQRSNLQLFLQYNDIMNEKYFK